MKQLFMLECKKTAKSITYWLFVVAVAIAFWNNYGNIDEEEISNASQAYSIFYTAQDNEYASEKKDLSDESQQQKMMLGMTKKLLYCYRNNSYEYYPFGYIKEKVFSKVEQDVVLKYLQEMTGMDKEEIVGNTEAASSEEIGISGEGAYVAGPGAGRLNEDGQYVFQPDEWEYVEDPSVSEQDREDSDDFNVQVSFARFKEIMDEISGMIGKNSYFSWDLINLYYGENDMEDSPVTLKQHEEFYKKDKITGAFARFFCDSIALEILLLPAFVITEMMVKDRRCRIMDLANAKSISSFQLIFTRYVASAVMMFVPVLLLPIRSFIILLRYAEATGNVIDILAFPKYIFGWILPTLLFVAALSMFVAVLTGNPISVLVVGVIWLFFKPSVGKIAGGNYELFDLVIRHNTLKGYGRMMQQFNMLVMNRLVITGIAVLFVLLSVWLYQVKRRGGLRFDWQEFLYYYKGKL